VRAIRILQHISLDGVIQSPGGPEEDRDGGFRHGGWTTPFADPDIKEAILAAQGERFDLLLGRRVYDIWCTYWPGIEDNPLADGFNAATKHVVTRRPHSLGWGPSEGLGPDVATGIRRVKAMQGPDLVVWGSSTVTPILLRQGLADEIVLFVYPLLLGAGMRMLPADAPR